MNAQVASVNNKMNAQVASLDNMISLTISAKIIIGILQQIIWCNVKQGLSRSDMSEEKAVQRKEFTACFSRC